MGLLLVIDEDKDSSALLERVFQRQGHMVATFIRGKEALKWLKANSPDLAIVSAGKHGERASELVPLLRSAGIEGADIVLNTSVDSLGAVRKAFGGDVREVLIKTSDLEKLEAVVNSSLPP